MQPDPSAVFLHRSLGVSSAHLSRTRHLSSTRRGYPGGGGPLGHPGSGGRGPPGHPGGGGGGPPRHPVGGEGSLVHQEEGVQDHLNPKDIQVPKD